MNKDRWDKLKITSEVIIALTALSFTIIFGVKEVNNKEATLKLAQSNLELAKAERMTALIQYLFSQDIKQRDFAWDILFLVDPLFTEKFTNSKMAGSSSDSSEKKEEKKEIVEKDKNGKYNLINKLNAPLFLKKIKDANGYIKGGSPNGYEEALKLYHEIISQLSQDDLKNFDQNLLNKAQKDEKEKHIENAVHYYRALFQEYTK